MVLGAVQDVAYCQLLYPKQHPTPHTQLRAFFLPLHSSSNS